MNIKGFADNNTNIETPTDLGVSEKPLKKEETLHKRVDINVLKARARSIENKENFKNGIIIIIFLMALGASGIYFSI